MRALTNALSQLKAHPGPIVFLTGAGISAESNIPTFRGEEGYWRAGSRRYHPQELATRHAFSLIPAVVWSWYLWRLVVCSSAQPHVAHDALARAGDVLGDRVLVVTQNVDGLHRRAGTRPDRIYEIHGNIGSMRCARGCPGVFAIPFMAAHTQGASNLTDEERSALVCPHCGARTRPHVLWFDETYDEPLYRYESSLRAANDAALLVVIGTTGATNLPLQMGRRAAQRGIPMIVINPEANPFSEMARHVPDGVFLRGTAGEWVSKVVDHVIEVINPSNTSMSPLARSLTAPRLLVEVLGEGSRVALEGQQDSTGNWRYRVIGDSRMLRELGPAYQSIALERGMDTHTPDLGPNELYRQTPWLDTWEAAMEQMDGSCWANLWPSRIDRTFAWRILQEVRARFPDEERTPTSRRWRMWCRQASEPNERG